MMQAEQQIDIATVPDDWESLTSAGLEMRAAQDTQRWGLGALAAKVDRRYGQGSLKKFASDIKMDSANTLYDYHAVYRYYENCARDEFPAIHWSHYRTAMHLKSLDKSLEFLRMANDKDMPVAALNRAVKKAMGKPVPPERHTFEVQSILQAGNGKVLLAVRECDDIRHYTTYHKDAAVTVTIEWTAAP